LANAGNGGSVSQVRHVERRILATWECPKNMNSGSCDGNQTSKIHLNCPPRQRNSSEHHGTPLLCNLYVASCRRQSTTRRYALLMDLGFEPLTSANFPVSLLAVTCYPLPVSRYLLPATRYPLPVICYPLPVAFRTQHSNDQPE